MKRPNAVLKWLLGVCLVLAAAEFAALTWLAPHYVMWIVERAARGKLTVDGAELSFPLTTTLKGLRLTSNSPDSSLTIQRVAIRPRWISPITKTVWLDAVEVRQPFIRITRTKAGDYMWLSLPQPAAPPAESAPSSGDARPWRVRIKSLAIVDGTIEYIDWKPSGAFHGVLGHISLDVGPVIIPLGGAGSSSWALESAPAMSVAVRGRFSGAAGHSAPIFCSGWWSLEAKDLQASCQLDPIALAAFEPYFRGPPELRVYAATLGSTSQWTAKTNDFNGRIQLELDHLTEGDVSIRGRNIIDVKKLFANGQRPRLIGEISLVGPLGSPQLWHAALLAGNDQVQQLLKRLLDRGIEVVRVPLLSGRHMPLSLIPSSAATMTTIDKASREVQEALEILAFQPQEPVQRIELPRTVDVPASAPPTPMLPIQSPVEPPPPGASSTPEPEAPSPSVTPNGTPLPPSPLKPGTGNQ
jgi:hypothetical protein